MGAAQPQASRHIEPNDKARVVLSFDARACCGTSSGFPDRYLTSVPERLAEAGIDQQTWMRWVDDYHANVEPESNECCFIFWLILAWCLLIPGIVMTFCCHYGIWSPYHKAARGWLDRVNDELRPRGMLAKWQTMIEQRDRHRVECSTLSFALTEAESQALDNEPSLVQPDCCDCCGFAAIDVDRVV